VVNTYASSMKAFINEEFRDSYVVMVTTARASIG
jgi:hypothetical protein